MTSFTIRIHHLLLGLAFIALSNLNACSHSTNKETLIVTNKLDSAMSQQLKFFNTLRSFCGQRFIGQSSFPANPEDSFYNKTLIATFLTCDEKEIRVPFSVGDDHSRTWIFRLLDQRLELKHQHLHKDGTPDEVSNYGGIANNQGTRHSQYFPADEFTRKLIPDAATNVWNIELSENKETLTYYLERHNKPRFKASLKRSDIKL